MLRIENGIEFTLFQPKVESRVKIINILPPINFDGINFLTHDSAVHGVVITQNSLLNAYYVELLVAFFHSFSLK